ncbi:MAG TPA: tRNA (adenosine(37)-N6)-dimethylallyltransferase MiaA [Acidobacteriota bacterium]|nr:tRNA (adenosine(37)-N6)-dimethylallyltransferase MiaA [Acidobacteriota bacterium]
MQSSGQRSLVIIAGPTASGKSALALKAALRLGGEIVNCDSMQLHRGLAVGTAKPSDEERATVPHHLYDRLDPDEFFSAGRYMKESREICAAICGRGHLPLVVGGTGLYLRALLQGVFEGPSADQDLRRRLKLSEEQKGPGHLYRMLKRLDPEAASRIQPADLVRQVRALEVHLLSGQPLSRLQKRTEPLQGYSVLKVGLRLPRRDLYDRIDRRVSKMFRGGLLEEVKRLLDAGYSPESKGFEALGYRHAAAALQGQLSLSEAIERTQADTRRYAKRQMTWFRREKGMLWLNRAGEADEALSEFMERFRREESWMACPESV